LTRLALLHFGLSNFISRPANCATTTAQNISHHITGQISRGATSHPKENRVQPQFFDLLTRYDLSPAINFFNTIPTSLEKEGKAGGKVQTHAKLSATPSDFPHFLGGLSPRRVQGSNKNVLIGL